MRRHLGTIIILALAVSSLASATSQDQSAIDELKKTAVKVYLDCGYCDIEYIKTEITFVNYVRDRNEAQVHILVTSSQTASGGRE